MAPIRTRNPVCTCALNFAGLTRSSSRRLTARLNTIVSQETMKPRYLTTTLSISALCLLSACVGVPVHDIRNSPIVYESVSSRSMNDVLSCLTAALDQFRGDSRMLTTSYPQPPVIEISIGAIQMGSFRHHYLLMITSFDEGAKILVRSAGTTFIPMPQSELIKHVVSCTRDH